MEQYINKNRVEEILRNLWKKDDGHNAEHRICYNKALQEVQYELDTLDVKAVDLTDRKIDWSPSKKQMESLKDMLKWNIGDFNYQKWMEVNSLYEDLTNSKLFDETDRQK